MTNLLKCHLCGHEQVELIPEYEQFARVTSDCRPWPSGGRLGVCGHCATVQKDTAKWNDNFEDVYATYTAYRQGRGAEQSVFLSAIAESRSAALLRMAAPILAAGASGRMLDVGCGDGSLLTAFHHQHPNWRMTGADLTPRYRDQILRIEGVEAFHAGDVRDLAQQFDVVTMMHVLEHILSPASFLVDLRQRLSPSGALLIEVPDLDQNPFDLLVADHCTHFSKETLRRTIAEAGFSIASLQSTWIPKELSLVARVGDAVDSLAPDVAATTKLVRAHIAWLDALRTQAFLVSEKRKFGLFGTAIAATWMLEELGDRVAFFVDEDPNRIGWTYYDRPILAPSEVSPESSVFIPLAPMTAASVMARLRQHGVDAHAPMKT